MSYYFDDDKSETRKLQEQIDSLKEELNRIYIPTPDVYASMPSGGIQGQRGQRGTNIVSGQADPTITTGFIQGDKFLNTASGKLFELVENSQTAILEWVEKISSIIGAPGEGAETTNIGVINGTKIVDLSETSKDQLYATLMADNISITFTNPDVITNLNLELVLGVTITNLAVAGVSVDVSDVSVGNKLYLEVSTIDSGYTWDVKKKLDSDSKPPSVPRSFSVNPARYGVTFEKHRLDASWLPSVEGEAVKYTSEISQDENFFGIYV